MSGYLEVGCLEVGCLEVGCLEFAKPHAYEACRENLRGVGGGDDALPQVQLAACWHPVQSEIQIECVLYRKYALYNVFCVCLAACWY